MRNINLKGTEHFEAVARLGSVTKAAEELGVTPSAISQQIKLLETQFGVRLFRREKRRMSLTEEGDRLFQATTRAFAALRNTGNAISRHREVRNLTLRVSPSFGVRWLGPRIASFAEQNLDWNIRVDATPDFSNFDTDAVDLDLRYGVGGWAGVAERPVMNDLVLPLCAPGYRDRMAAAGDTVAERLSAARLIDSVKAMFRWDLWLAANQVELEDYDYPFRYDRSSMSIETAKQGAGLALDSATLCLPDLERGELVPAFPDIPVALLRRGRAKDSSRESSVVAGPYEQTDPAELQDQDLAGLQQSPQAARFPDDLVRSGHGVGAAADRQAKPTATV